MTNNFGNTLELNGVHALKMLAHMLAHFKQKKAAKWNLAAFCDPAGTRTQDPYIKSVLLYQLSYGIISFSLSF